MILEFKFNYINKTNLLAYFLDFYAKKSSLPYSIHKENDDISLFVEGKEEELLKFSDEWMILIPNSVFLTKSEVLVVDEMKEPNLEIPNLKLPNLTPSVVKNYVNHSGSLENECGVFSEISVLINGEFVEVNEANYKELIKTLVLNLTHNQSVTLKDKNSEFILKNGLEFDSGFIMPTSFKSVEKAFIMDEKSYIALSSYEKPVLNLKLNAIFRQNNKGVPAFFDVKAASDFFVFALLDALYGKGVNFVSVKGEIKLKASVLDERILVTRNKVQRDPNTPLFKEICNEFDINDKININIALSKVKPDVIKIYKDGKAIDLLKFREFKNFEEIKEAIASDDVGNRLLNNFQKEFEFPTGEIKNSDSFYALFDIVSKVLFGKDAFYLIESAKDSILKKGPSIDYKEESGEFDTIKFIRSGMSFRLAGVDSNVLAYGYAESLIYFLDRFLENYEYDNAIITGCLFEEKIFANFAEKHLKAKFSNYLGV